MPYAPIHRRAFTLIELLVVIVIIGLLTAAATTSYISAQRRSRDNARKSQVNTIANAIESYYAVKHSFPGKYDVASYGTPGSNQRHCEEADGSYFYYYYYPLAADDTGISDTQYKHCDDPSRATSTATYSYDPSLFSPYPTWVPGMAPYLSPPPIDRRFQDQDGVGPNSSGASTGTYSELLEANGVSAQRKTVTYVYRKLDGGFMVATRLESQDDKDIITSKPTDRPLLPTNVGGPTGANWGTNIYMIRR